VALPRPLLGRAGCDFSFSGLKTAVSRQVGRAAAADIAASFQRAVAEVLADRAGNALRATGARVMVVAGGVAANGTVRAALAAVAGQAGAVLIAPPLRLCGDNAVMVAWAGLERWRLGWTDGLDHAPRPRWPLDAADMRPAPITA
jgi:N6-L-threonylcarbamoyladenine synthase